MLEYNSYIEQHTNDNFVAATGQLLDQHPEGISEYELIKGLRDSHYFPFLNQAPATAQALFCAHFLLYHALYRLRDNALKNQSACLTIGALRIVWRPYKSVDKGLDKLDKIREYYLDVSNLIITTARDVDKLITSFWSRLQKTDQRTEALAALGLNYPVDNESIKLAYRRMVMKHHPDRGGDKEQFQIVNAAVEQLLKSN